MFGRRTTSQAVEAVAPAPPSTRHAEVPATTQITRTQPPAKRKDPAAADSKKANWEATLGKLQAILYDRVEASAAARLPREDLLSQVLELIGEIVVEHRLSLSNREQSEIAATIVDDMLGLGPLEPLIRDETITDIMINGPKQIYIERRGKLELTDVRFRDGQHLMNVAQRIVTRIGRRVDETCPICDARLEDGSRVNVIAPPSRLMAARSRSGSSRRKRSRSTPWRRKGTSRRPWPRS